MALSSATPGPVTGAWAGGRRGIHGGVRVWANAASILAVIGLQVSGPDVNAVTYVGLSVWALLGVRQTIQALTVTWVALFLNPAIFESTPYASALRWVVLFAGCTRVFLALSMRLIRTQSTIPRYWLWLFLFVVAATIGAFSQSPDPLLSASKAAMFLAGVVTVMGAFWLVIDEGYWRDWFWAVILVVLFASLPLIGHDLGFAKNQRGFQGVLSHPQAYGVFLAPAFAWWAGRAVFGPRSWMLLPLVVISGLSLLLTQSRTAVLAVLAALGATVVLRAMPHGRWRHRYKGLAKPGNVAFSVFAFLSLGVAIYSFQWEVKDFFLDFFLKSRTEETVGFALSQSRDDLIQKSLENFRKHPWMGIGLGIPSEERALESTLEAVPVGLPVAAPVEKGLLLTALLEETGLIGTLVFAVFLFSLLAYIVRLGDLPTLWMAMAGLFVNIGEAVLLSFGGMGLWVWLVLGYATSQTGLRSSQTVGSSDRYPAACTSSVRELVER